MSMLPFVLVSYRHGVKWGMITGFRQQPDPACCWALAPSGILPDPHGTLGCVLLDYLLAFMVLGFA